jgi:hypothetical protein
MLASACRKIGRMTSGGSVLLAICAASVSVAGCASGARLSRNLLQSPNSGQRAGLIPGSWDKTAVLRPGILAAAGSGDGYLLASANWGAPLLLSAVGAVIGVFIDRAHRDDQVVYIRP